MTRFCYTLFRGRLVDPFALILGRAGIELGFPVLVLHCRIDQRPVIWFILVQRVLETKCGLNSVGLFLSGLAWVSITEYGLRFLRYGIVL